MTLRTLAAGASATVTITTIPQSAGSLTCQASVNSQAVDPDLTNNKATKVVSVGFNSTPDSVNMLRLAANNLIYDPIRQILWATVPAGNTQGLARTLLSIDPKTGLISDPIPIGANPASGSLTISKNGRFLYLGLNDLPEIHRVDLEQSAAVLRIPMGNSQWASANRAGDFAPLDGDGTSFLVAGLDDHSAYVFDGLIRRPNFTGIYTVDRIERVGTGNAFVGYNAYTSGYELSRLNVNSAGVAITQSIGSVVSGYSTDIRGDNGFILSSTGKLIDSSTFNLKTNFSIAGRPCLDTAYQRAFFIAGNQISSYDINTFLPQGAMPLATNRSGDWAQNLVRWGQDGFAVLGSDDRIYIARWTGAMPADLDTDLDGLPDAWEISQFNSSAGLASDDHDGDGFPDALEYLFASDPNHSTNSQSATISKISAPGGFAIRMTYQRRAGVPVNRYRIETSSTLADWVPATGVTETVLSTQTLPTLEIQTVECTVPMPSPDSGFVRFHWLPTVN